MCSCAPPTCREGTGQPPPPLETPRFELPLPAQSADSPRSSAQSTIASPPASPPASQAAEEPSPSAAITASAAGTLGGGAAPPPGRQLRHATTLAASAKKLAINKTTKNLMLALVEDSPRAQHKRASLQGPRRASVKAARQATRTGGKSEAEVRWEQLHADKRGGYEVRLMRPERWKGRAVPVESVRRCWAGCRRGFRLYAAFAATDLPPLLSAHDICSGARGGREFTRHCSLQLGLAWALNVAVFSGAASVVGWFLLLQARLVEQRGIDSASYAAAVANAYLVSLAVSLLGKDVAQSIVVAVLPVKSNRSRRIVGCLSNAIASLVTIT